MSEQLSLQAARSYLLERANERGVGLEVFAIRSTETEVSAFGGEVSEFKLASQQGLGLRALVGGRWGYASTENLSAEALDHALREAVENAELVAPEVGARLHAWPEPPELDLHGEGLSGVTVEQKVNVALTLERAAHEADPRVVSLAYGGYNDGDYETLIGNTEGFARGYQSLHAMQYAAPLVAEGGQHKMKSDWQFSREFAELDPTHTALEATRKALALLGARPAPTGHFPAVIQHECLAELLALFAGMFSAKAVQEGQSPLAGRLGERLASERVTLRDDPTLPRGLRSRPFDAEGSPSAPLTLLAGGVLQTFLHNAQTAAKDGVTSTGHALRNSHSSPVGVGHSNLFMEPGGTPPEALQAGLTGVLVTGVSGGHAGADPITGDFSLQAEGFWLQAGEVAHPLEVFTVAGNILDLLAAVEAVGDDLHWTLYGTGAPSVRVPDLAVGGE